MSAEETCPNCTDPVERHTAWWGGCKYCGCAWLPDDEARGAMLFALKRMRLDFLGNRHIQMQMDRSHRIAIESPLDAAIIALQEQGVKPLPAEGEDTDGIL